MQAKNQKYISPRGTIINSTQPAATTKLTLPLRSCIKSYLYTNKLDIFLKYYKLSSSTHAVKVKNLLWFQLILYFLWQTYIVSKWFST